ncbi:acetyl-CoA C-acetyltransferase [Nocardia goodfellowii]|uniref:Probable acetyl-CoA acetyltransferase n=1 Tax=Nocardia goodfellowii TaxID=882446 RepID=A0ABS4QIR1_9NOCA|nr:acetyl-CoA C-acetyltransferase [Nocardia goodfellowii]
MQHVVLGQVMQSDIAFGPARVTALDAGIPSHVPATTVQRACISGFTAITVADQMIRDGVCDVVLAIGQESLSQVKDAADNTIFNVIADLAEQTDRFNEKAGIDRAAQDDYTVSSHERSRTAQSAGRLREEIVSVELATIGAPSSVIDDDEGIDPTAAEWIGRMNPVRGPGGTMTYATIAPAADGACALVLMRKDLATAEKIDWLAEIGAHTATAGPQHEPHTQPAAALGRVLDHAGLRHTDLAWIEINEAMASIPIHTIRALGLNPAVVNAEGGALALGHPAGMSGARIVLHLAYALRRRGGGIGAAAIAGDGGQGAALILNA